MKRCEIIVLLVVIQTLLSSLMAIDYYFFVQFSDKHDSPYSTLQPEAYLSSGAIARRAHFQIPVDSLDLPVNPSYVNQVQATGVKIHSQSKWLNGVTIHTADSNRIQAVQSLSFVTKTQFTGRMNATPTAPQRSKWAHSTDSYGLATNHTVQINGNKLHEQGATGKGILIGVLDGGFKNVNLNPAFDSLRTSGRLIGAVNIVDPGKDVYLEDAHGSSVLSVMAGRLSGNYNQVYTGSAPDASYWLLQTEHVPSEYLFETDFWVRGIEFADSAGVDVINSSLGYTEFDDAGMNFSYSDMNGTVSRASIAAGIAAKKGIIVCTSAGNSGNLPWKYISSPADADGIITVGSVDSNGNASGFSSWGPASDGRIKPEMVANGGSTGIITPEGITSYGRGTSFASPVIAGFTACYLQLLYEKKESFSIEELIHSIILTTNLRTSPQAQMGYGIPDFAALPELAPTHLKQLKSTIQGVNIQLDPAHRILHLHADDFSSTMSCSLLNLSGQVILSKSITSTTTELNIDLLPPGIYLLTIRSEKGQLTRKISLY